MANCACALALLGRATGRAAVDKMCTHVEPPAAKMHSSSTLCSDMELCMRAHRKGSTCPCLGMQLLWLMGVSGECRHRAVFLLLFACCS